eukprot:TRINITY_DN3674_c0_g1_i1.p1 TRINITY_DN3674_c0_g1~~TRINITY_DN3674_c0_g1_i1.p1  ORF type:complete len:211 (+),score=34.01 TRINITY_DN3674_c0_g1_i1:157-789(+)
MGAIRVASILHLSTSVQPPDLRRSFIYSKQDHCGSIPCSKGSSDTSLRKLGGPKEPNALRRQAVSPLTPKSRQQRTRIAALGNDDNESEQPPPGCSRIKVDLRRPLGLVLEEALSGGIFVCEILPDSHAARAGVIDVGDELLATSAVVYKRQEEYGGVAVQKGMERVRLTVRGEKFETVMAAIGTHLADMTVTLELQKCDPSKASASANA